MKITGKGRWLIIGAISLLLVIAVDSDMSGGGDAKAGNKALPAAHAAHRERRTADASAAEEIILGQPLKRDFDADPTVDLFKGKSWYVPPPPPPPPPPPKPVPPPKPTAPPLPYAFLGSYLGEDGRLLIFLTRGERVFQVSPGDVLEGTYRVEIITAGHLGLIYLPLNIRQTLSVGEAS